ncbi:MAG: DegT/DnrJ/EryC1/StrS family aminotransferase [Cellvibrionaceae bacterium]
MEFIDLKAQYQYLEERIDSRIKQVLSHGKYIMGPEVSELEERLANFVGVKNCISCANGTDALQLALMAKGIGPGDAVFTTPFTFFATAEVIALVGATPVFVDICEDTYNIDPQLLRKAVEEVESQGELNPAAVIAVDLFGLPANYQEIQSVADRYGLYLIEDAAQGFGGEIDGQRAGSFGDVATTSFFPAKPLGCYGDGGALFTNDDDLAQVLRSLRVHGKGVDKYDNVRIGMNSRLDTLQAAILLEKFEVFPREVELRNAAAARYSTALKRDFFVPIVPEGFVSSWAQFTIRSKAVRSRQSYMDALKEKGIPTAVYYGKSLHRQQAFSGSSATSMPVSERVESEVFSLPMHPYLKEEEQRLIIEALLQA